LNSEVILADCISVVKWEGVGIGAIAYAMKFAPTWESPPERWEKVRENARFVGCRWRKSDLKDPDVGKVIQIRLPLSSTRLDKPEDVV
jgi:hypothetical protein